MFLVDAPPIEGGCALLIGLPPERSRVALKLARKRVSESSCGLCGIENIEEVLRPLPPVTARIATDRTAIEAALTALEEHQPLGRATGAVHAAAFCSPAGDIRLVRSEEHTSELQSLMRISYAVFCLKNKKHKNKQ